MFIWLYYTYCILYNIIKTKIKCNYLFHIACILNSLDSLFQLLVHCSQQLIILEALFKINAKSINIKKNAFRKNLKLKCHILQSNIAHIEFLSTRQHLIRITLKFHYNSSIIIIINRKICLIFWTSNLNIIYSTIARSFIRYT